MRPHFFIAIWTACEPPVKLEQGKEKEITMKGKAQVKAKSEPPLPTTMAVAPLKLLLVSR
ncbi:hypothetical protein AAF712_016222 [Marasmius tenuissimus]|uniref:Uncharacterized protein n=1 Tax=Marasmius tenuissimus TaxID=585030 RepID=A0ABR2Z694_9AGAR